MIIITYQILLNPVLYLLYLKICINNAITALLTVSTRFPSRVENLTYRVQWYTFYGQHVIIIIIDMSELFYQIKLLRIEGNKHVVPIEAPYKWQHVIIIILY